MGRGYGVGGLGATGLIIGSPMCGTKAGVRLTGLPTASSTRSTGHDVRRRLSGLHRSGVTTPIIRLA